MEIDLLDLFDEIVLEQISNTDRLLRQNMSVHYSQPKGFVGRNICYKISYGNKDYGTIVGGSCTFHLPGRDEYFQLKDNDDLKYIVNNVFYHIEKQDEKYPLRWFTAKVLAIWRETIAKDWFLKYGDRVIGFECLVEKPRTGLCYQKDKWFCLSETKGYSCKRTEGVGTDSYSGARIWDTENLKPKLVFVRYV